MLLSDLPLVATSKKFYIDELEIQWHASSDGFLAEGR